MTFKDHVESVIQGMGIDEAMKKFACSRQTLWNWRTGRLTPSLAKLEEMGGVVNFPEVELQPKAQEIAQAIPGVTTGAALERTIVRDADAQDW